MQGRETYHNLLFAVVWLRDDGNGALDGGHGVCGKIKGGGRDYDKKNHPFE